MADRSLSVVAPGVSFVGGVTPPLANGGVEPAQAGVGRAGANVVVVTPGMTMAEIERSAIEAALRETRGNRRKAAEILAIGERTLYRKLKEYNLPLGDYDSDN